MRPTTFATMMTALATAALAGPDASHDEDERPTRTSFEPPEPRLPPQPSRLTDPSDPTLEARIDARIAAARRAMERRARKLPVGEANALRARFDAKLARLDADAHRAAERGEATAAEAAAVRRATIRQRRASLV